MKGKVCLVCGGTSGIGLETCRALAHLGVQVVLTGTTLEKAQRVAEELGHEAVGLQLDLTDYASIVDFAGVFLERYERLDVLIHNAGLELPKRQENPQGIEATFAVTYLGPFVLTNKLWPLTSGATKTRLINVCSDLHRNAKMDFDDLQSRKRYNFISVFSKAELAKMIWTQELSRRLSPTQATANSLHPGGVKTDLFRHFRGPTRWLLWLSNQLKVSAKKGAQTSIYLATSSEVEDQTGSYFVKCKPKKPAPAVLDSNLASRLWEESERLVLEWASEDTAP